MVSRMLGVAPTIADAIVDQLSRPSDKAVAAGSTDQQLTEAQATSMSAGVWRAAWPVERLRQRAFFTFGMDVLLKLNLEETRSFFNAFFSLSAFNWHGFLSARLDFWQLIAFGLSLFANSSNQSRLDLLVKGLPGLMKMLLELAPTLGDYYGVKKEQQQLLREANTIYPTPGLTPPTAAAAAAGAAGSNGKPQQQDQQQPEQQQGKVPVGAGASSSSSNSNSTA
jgi:lycopene beta-cyclase